MSIALMPLTIGRPSARATRTPTWKPPASADSLPNRSTSNGPALGFERAHRLDDRARGRLRVGILAARDRVVGDEDRVLRADRDREAQLFLGFGRPDREHGDVAAVRLDEPDRLLDRALLVRARREGEVPRVDRAPSAVSVICAPGAGTRFTQTRMRSNAGQPFMRVVGIEQRARAGDGDLHRVVLVHVADAQLGADDRVLRREVREQEELADRRPRARRRDHRRPALGVDDAFAVGREDRLGAGHVAGDAVTRRDVILDRERAQHGGGLGLTGEEIGLLADEVGGLDLRARQAGFHRRVLAVELGAHEAVALLEPAGRAVHAGADRGHAERLTGFPEPVPDRERVVARNVDLPAVLADVGDAEEANRDRVDQHLGRRAVGERGVGDVVGGDRFDEGARLRSPHADRRERRRCCRRT